MYGHDYCDRCNCHISGGSVEQRCGLYNDLYILFNYFFLHTSFEFHIHHVHMTDKQGLSH